MINIELDFRDLKKVINPIYYKYLYDFRRYQILKGGSGAGKSVFAAQKILYHLITQKGFNVLCTNKIGANNHDTSFAELKKWINKWSLNNEAIFKINESKGSEEITFIENKNKIIFRGLDDPEKIKSVTFDTGDLTCIWIEEASAIDLYDFTQLDLRLRGEGPIEKFMILTFNPIDIDSWIKARFFDRKLDEKDGYILETTYKDNRYLDKKYIETLENLKETSQYHYDVYVLGKWGNVAGTKVFYNLEIHDFDIEPTRYKNLRHGLDFGFDHPQVFVSNGEIENDLYIFNEIYKKGLYNKEFIDIMKLMKVPTDFIIAADSARPDCIAELQKNGYKYVIGALKKPGGEALGVRYLNRFKKIHIHKTNCPNTARSFQAYKKLQIRDKIFEDKYVDIDDDPIDAVRYSRFDLIYAYAQTGDIKKENFAAGF